MVDGNHRLPDFRFRSSRADERRLGNWEYDPSYGSFIITYWWGYIVTILRLFRNQRLKREDAFRRSGFRYLGG